MTRPDAVPGMIATVQTFGDLAHWHPHVHTIVTDGLFAEDGTFLPLPKQEDGAPTRRARQLTQLGGRGRTSGPCTRTA
jgi:hypothetical protein